jgi:hypothetical protein
MALEPTDNYIVERDETLYSIEQRSLTSKIEDTDLFAVGRGDTNYHVAWSEMKDELGGGGSIPDAFPEPDQITAVPDFVSGIGTSGNPYRLNDVTVNQVGGTAYTDELITIDMGIEGIKAVNFELTFGPESRFEQDPKITSNVGVWTGRLIYKDIPPTEEDTTYYARFKIGDTYFKWDVHQKATPLTPPEIESVSLVETNPNADPRFTDQTFDASVSMAEQGEPVSTKYIDAYVEGSITTTGQFDEPLESSDAEDGTITIEGRTWSDDVTYTGGPTQSTPAAMFNGLLGVTNGTYYFYTTNGTITWDTSDYPLSGQLIVHTYQGGGDTSGLVRVYSGDTYVDFRFSHTGEPAGDQEKNIDCGNVSGVTKIEVSNGTTLALVSGFTLDGQIIVNNQDFDMASKVLTFAAGTDMSALAAGDTVEQTTATADTWSNNITTGGSGNDGNNQNAFDGDEATTFRIGGTGASTYFQWEIGHNIKGSVFKAKVVAQANTGYQLLFMDSNNQNGYVASVNVDANGFVQFDTSNVNTTDDVSGVRIQIMESGKTNGLNAVYINDQIVVDGQPLPLVSGTVSSVTGTTVTLSSSSGAWTDGVNVTGPEKTVVIDNAKKYLKFNDLGEVSDLLDNPQSPTFETIGTDPGLLFTFPSTFPSGQAPDDELGEGTTLTVDVYASNDAGSTPHETATVQPEGPTGPDVNLNGLTTLYTGNNTTNVILNGIDLVNNDGMVWIKSRSNAYYHYLFDTVRGRSSSLSSNLSNAADTQYFEGKDLASFDESGFSLGPVYARNINNSGETFAAWTFEKAANYFDVQTFTTTGSSQNIPHDLATPPGFIIVKDLDAGGNWYVYHKNLPPGTFLSLNQAGPVQSADLFPAVTDTDWTFGGGAYGPTGRNMLAYLFAEDTSAVKCGFYDGTGNSQFIDTGFDPQWVMIKSSNTNAIWSICDNKRGSNGVFLQPHVEAKETGPYPGTFALGSNGFNLLDSDTGFNAPGSRYVYVAIAAPVVRSLTQGEFNEQELKFGTYNIRKEIAEQGYSQDDILKYL